MNKQYQEFCIFCGGKGLTFQHVWPNWMRKTVQPPSADFTQLLGRSVNYRNDLHNEVRKKQGHPLNTQFRKVCATCNNGWISELESSIKPTLVKLMNGEKFVISPNESKKIATWSAIVTIMAEYMDMPNKMIPSSDAQYIFLNRIPPPRWLIRMGRYLGNEHSPFRYRHVAGKSSEIVPAKSVNAVQSSLHVIEQLLIHAASAAFDDIMEENVIPFYERGLYRIWPHQQEDIQWDPPAILGDEATDGLAEQLLDEGFADHRLSGDERMKRALKYDID